MIVTVCKRIFITLSFIVLSAPLFIVSGVSLNAKKLMFFPPRGLSFKWYPEVFEKTVWFEALTNSLIIASCGALLAVSIALPTSYFLWRYRVTYAKVLFGLGLVPFSLPPVITALGMLIFWAQWIGYAGRLENIIIAHGVFLVTLPMVMISLGLESIDDELLEAAETMGADRRKVFSTVIFPMVPALHVRRLCLCLCRQHERIHHLVLLGPVSDHYPAGADPGQPQIRLLADHRLGRGHVYPARCCRLLTRRTFQRSAQTARRLVTEGIGFLTGGDVASRTKGCTNMYILYGGSFTRALAPQMVLEEAGLPYELRVVDMAAREHRSEEFLKLNPAGYVPALVTPEGDVLHEAAAIMLYLADRHGLDDMAPSPTDPQRGVFLSKLFYFTNDIQPSCKRFYFAHRYALRDEDIAAVRAQSREMVCERWQVLDDWLATNGPYHLGERFTMADLHLAMWATYGFENPTDILDLFPATCWVYEHVLKRPKSGPLLQGLIEVVTARRQG